LVPTVLYGTHEWMAHLTQLVLVWIAVVAMTALIFRFGWGRRHAIAGALLLVALPPFLPMASTAMPDILATALALVAMERLAAWKAELKWSQCAAAAVALGLAGFARPHLALLLPLAAFFLLDSNDPREILEQVRRKPWLWTPVFAGTALMLAVMIALREHSAAPSPVPVASGGQHVTPNLLAYLLYIVFPLPLAACWVAYRVKIGRLPVISILAAVAVVPWFFFWNQPFAQVLAFIGLAVIGCNVLADLLFRTLKTRDHTGLFLMLWILIPLPIVYYAHLPMKYLLPCIPAVILVCFQLMEGISVRIVRVAAIAMIVASTGYSLLILRSDAEFAQFGHDALYQLIQPHVAAGETVWYGGQYWSYWYAPLDGATLTFPGGPQPKPGDLLVTDEFAWEVDPPQSRFPHRTLVAKVTHKYRFGRTMGAGIGLYSNGFGHWLWGFGDSDKDRFELWRID
jgi:4-amino-4-deoxy-L-arabinose transferase-like glycosyltransferase